MRWLFLLTLAALTFAGYAAILDEYSTERSLGSVAFTCCVAGLFALWRSAYFANGPRRVRQRMQGIAWLLSGLALGAALRAFSVFQGHDCPAASRRNGWIARLLEALSSDGNCEFYPIALAAGSAVLFVMACAAWRQTRSTMAH